MPDIDSPKNPNVIAAARLHRRRHRRQTGLTILEGPNVVTAALDAGAQLETLYSLAADGRLEARARSADVEVITVSEEVLARVSGTKHPRGPVAVAPIPPTAEARPVDSLVLAGVTDPGNAGTIIRSAAAFGFQVVAAGTGVDLWSPKVVRAGAGAHFATRIVEMAADPTAPLVQVGIVPVAMVAVGGGDIDALPSRPVAFLIGSEPHGLPEALARSCELRVTLEMGSATESLNASVAASIAMWARLRSRLL